MKPPRALDIKMRRAFGVDTYMVKDPETQAVNCRMVRDLHLKKPPVGNAKTFGGTYE
jgi:hypothetical protein